MLFIRGSVQNQEIAEEAVPALRNNLDAIHTVAEWARVSGYSRAHFSILVKQYLGEPPLEIIRREKFKRIKNMVRQNPGRKGRVIANRTGFADVKSLYKFLKKHYSTTLTAMRKEATSGG